MAVPKRYSWVSTITEFANNVEAQMSGDAWWEVKKYATAAVTGGGNWGNVVFTNLMDRSLAFTVAIQSGNGATIRWGILNNSTPKADVHLDSPDKQMTDTPFTSGANNTNTTYKWTVFTTINGIFVHGEYQNNTTYAYPIRIYMGRLNPLEQEDPAIANDFVGIFTHMPSNISNANSATYGDYNVGRGIVRKSRNGTKYEYYNFTTDAQLTSPGVGGRYYVNPFMVFNPSEGVRGQFADVHTACFKDASQHPDGSILDLGENKYYVFHVVDQPMPYNGNYTLWYTSLGNARYSVPCFFGSNNVMGGQRVILFKI
ncbi:hypothetical protein SAMN05720606_11224 [Paenibacillus polysaccharolyticus]|uniref:Uncharacterized protein n=1 Tax=Paenibacillus polysaccharolyticus TaxID=582692 RepID=A0A1G5JVI9_9BACL|nr:hypothetical protein [Paenibacillus polysaccharolyticus]SCY91788.1 hypothetical protein SAMN05720606_11224 [Paenibacillus polysaccharolyticus]